MKKNYKIKITSKIKKKINILWQEYLCIENEYFFNIQNLEDRFAKETGIKDIEIFFSGDGAVGIGNTSRTMPLIQREDISIENVQESRIADKEAV